MAKHDNDLFKSLRARGVRKKIAKRLSRAASGARRRKLARRAMADLSSVVGEVQDRLLHGPEKRSAAGKKAARRRKAKALKRRRSAKRAARARA